MTIFFAPSGRLTTSLAVFGVLSLVINFPEGYTNSYPNTAVDSFQQFFNKSFVERGINLSSGTFTFLWSATLNVWFVGFLIGTFLTPPVTEKFGRKTSLIFATGVSLIGACLNLLSILIHIPEVFIIGRTVSSIGSGLSFGSLILFLQEVSPTHLRGVSSFLCETAFLLTTVLGIFCGMDIALGQHLVYLTGLSILPAIIAIILLLPMKETPKYLLLNSGDRVAATESVLFYHGKVNVDEILREISKEQEEDDDSSKNRSIIKDIVYVFTQKQLRTAFFIGMACLQIIVSFWPITYLSTVLLMDVFPSSLAQYTSLLFIVSNFLAALMGLYVVEKFGRRPLVLILGSVNTLALAIYIVFDVLSDYFDSLKYGTIFALVVFGVSYGIGLGPIAFFLTSELVVQQYRSLVQSIVYALSTCVSLVFSTATLPFYNVIGSYCFIPLFIIPSIGSLIYLYFTLPETKDREVHEIVAQLAGQHISPMIPLTLDEDEIQKAKRKSTNI